MREYIKKWFFSFVLVQTGITIAIGVFGTVWLKDLRVPYVSFLLPSLFAFLSLLPDLFLFSTKERGIRQTLLVDLSKLLLREGIVLGAQKLLAPGTSVQLLLTLGIMVFVIALVVKFVLWCYSVEESKLMNRKLTSYRKKSES